MKSFAVGDLNKYKNFYNTLLDCYKAYDVIYLHELLPKFNRHSNWAFNNPEEFKEYTSSILAILNSKNIRYAKCIPDTSENRSDLYHALKLNFEEKNKQELKKVIERLGEYAILTKDVTELLFSNTIGVKL